VLSDFEYQAKEAARVAGYHGCLGVPMVRDEQVVGAIFVARKRPGLFSDTQVQLLKTGDRDRECAVVQCPLLTHSGHQCADFAAMRSMCSPLLMC
jgi:signal transduction protein with GAF and PtsI domain